MRIASIIALSGLLIACGEKIPMPSNVRDDDGGKLTDTTFVPILPHWTSADGIDFDYPAGVSVGYDRTIYICDTRNDRIVRVTPSGEFIESFPMPAPQAVAQDRTFSLAAVNGTNEVWMRHYPSDAEFTPSAGLDSTWRCIPQPNAPPLCYWDVPHFEHIVSTWETVSRFFTIGVGRVYRVHGDPYIQFPVLEPVLDSSHAYGSVYNPTGLAAAMVGGRRRLIVAQYPSFYGVQYLTLPGSAPVFEDEGQDVLKKTLMDTKYVAADEHGNVFVLHRTNGLIMMFDKDGRFVLSFGRDGADELSLHDATSIAVFDDIVLVADAKNNRIVRFQLTATPQG